MARHSIRQATLADCDALASFIAEAWVAAYATVLPRPMKAPGSNPGDWQTYFASRPAEDRVWLAAARGGRIAGYARTGPARDDDLARRPGERWAELVSHYTDPGALREGTGTTLLGRVSDDLTTRGYTSLALWQFVGNPVAAAFYERRGLPLDGARRASRFGVDEVRRTATLPLVDPTLAR
ncbi:MAG: GNAT family N-acetyltransferase [Actinobacteria bacterium]|uniref:Unannotated protein n=1 Tax=freshwater metagenome TaxID=449393 RepID=A0A6J6P5V8_9ZZZZ|nr:GNAT family N-acetyltransferase [Actinomycetota bacterium]